MIRPTRPRTGRTPTIPSQGFPRWAISRRRCGTRAVPIQTIRYYGRAVAESARYMQSLTGRLRRAFPTTACAIFPIFLSPPPGTMAIWFASTKIAAYGPYFYVFGGTSASSPAAAGIMALVNQKLGGQPQGMANYVFYRLANTSRRLSRHGRRRQQSTGCEWTIHARLLRWARL